MSQLKDSADQLRHALGELEKLKQEAFEHEVALQKVAVKCIVLEKRILSLMREIEAVIVQGRPSLMIQAGGRSENKAF